MARRSISLSDYVYEELLHQFQSEKYQSGAKLPGELKLASEFSVSRPIVREALARLRDDGYITSKKGSGSFLVRADFASLVSTVPIREWADFENAFEYRGSLEALIAAKAAENATELDKVHIENTYRANCTRTASRYLDHIVRDFEFHRAIADATHNPFYCRALENLQKEILEGIERCSQILQSNRMTYRPKDNEHALIVKAIAEGKASLAFSTMMTHVNSSCLRIKQLVLNSSGESRVVSEEAEQMKE